MAKYKGHQQSFFSPLQKFFGGELLKGKRKSQRPLSMKRSLHIVLKSSKAKGKWAFFKPENRPRIEALIKKFAKINMAQVYQIGMNWNHFHCLMRFPSRKSYNCFIRSLTGTIPKALFGFENPEEGFWDYRPFTRVIEWGRDYKGVVRYLIKNVLEAQGDAVHQRPKRNPYAQWLEENGAFSSG